MTLEEKLTRLKEIQQNLTTGKVNLSESIKMLEEAMALKKDIDAELTQLENKLISLTKQGEVDNESNF
jgi:exodeoxyribonuclease VII small subunit